MRWYIMRVLKKKLRKKKKKKESACNEGYLGWEDPWTRERLPTPVFWPREYVESMESQSQTQLSDFRFY